MIRAALLAITLAAASTLAQDGEREMVIIPRSDVFSLIVELKRLRMEVQKMKDLLLACTA